MPKRAKELSALEVARIEPPGGYVGGVPGLYLAVGASGSKSWLLEFTLDGRRPQMGLGSYPSVTLAMAREKARTAKELVRAGVNPIEARKAGRSAELAKRLRTHSFDEVSRQYLRAHEAKWRSAKHAAQWAATLSTYASPVIGELNVEDVGVEHVLQVIEPHWIKKHETATRLRGRIEAVLGYAIARKYRPGPNPAVLRDNLARLLPTGGTIGKVTHHRALAVDEMPAFWTRLQAAEGQGAKALSFAILTAARSGEVRGATWGEVDLPGKLWTIPGARMKAGVEHRVPLSSAATALLRSLPRGEDDALLFPSASGGPLSDMTLSAVCRRLDVDAVPHGFRSTFRTWAGERTGVAREVIETALAHAIESAVEAAYMRGDLLAKRAKLMQLWADFCRQPAAAATVTPIRKGGRKPPA